MTVMHVVKEPPKKLTYVFGYRRHHSKRRGASISSSSAESVLATMAVPDPSMATVGASSECGDDKATARRTRNGEYSVIGADIGRHGDDVFSEKHGGRRSSKNPSNKW